MAEHVHRNDDPIECPYKDTLDKVLSPDHVVVRRDDLREAVEQVASVLEPHELTARETVALRRLREVI